MHAKIGFVTTMHVKIGFVGSMHAKIRLLFGCKEKLAVFFGSDTSKNSPEFVTNLDLCLSRGFFEVVWADRFFLVFCKVFILVFSFQMMSVSDNMGEYFSQENISPVITFTGTSTDIIYWNLVCKWESPYNCSGQSKARIKLH